MTQTQSPAVAVTTNGCPVFFSIFCNIFRSRNVNFLSNSAITQCLEVKSTVADKTCCASVFTFFVVVFFFVVFLSTTGFLLLLPTTTFFVFFVVAILTYLCKRNELHNIIRWVTPPLWHSEVVILIDLIFWHIQL